MSEAYYLVYFY